MWFFFVKRLKILQDQFQTFFIKLLFDLGFKILNHQEFQDELLMCKTGF